MDFFSSRIVGNVEAGGQHQADIGEGRCPSARVFFVKEQVGGFDIEGEHRKVRDFTFTQVAFGVTAVFCGCFFVTAADRQQTGYGGVGGHLRVVGDTDKCIQRVGVLPGFGLQQGNNVFSEVADEKQLGFFEVRSVPTRGVFEAARH